MKDFKPTQYSLVNVATERIFEDSGWTLTDPQSPEPSLVRAIYKNKHLSLRGEEYGLYTYADWLPIKRTLKGSAHTITYKSEKLAKKLSMNNLYIAFSGYWPEKGAFMRTCSFKETEAYSVCGRLSSDNKKILVVASAGNTARAFAQVCSDNGIKLLLCVPEDNLDALWFSQELNKCVKLISTPKGSDYFDAIALSQIACGSDLFLDEGGAKNIARRDGMGTTVLSATTTIGRIPDAYFQAIGSGTGTIAAFEANLRLIEDGRYGSHKMRLYPSQNIPFTIMYDAWKAGSRALSEMDEEKSRKLALAIEAKVLSNRKPPYPIRGGVYDVLKETHGDMEVADNKEVKENMELFKNTEGIDIHPAAAVALTGMIKTLRSGKISPDETVMLNITGGGEKLFKSQHSIHYLKPDLILEPKGDKELIINKIKSLFI
jgi:cysteate synthase